VEKQMQPESEGLLAVLEEEKGKRKHRREETRQWDLEWVWSGSGVGPLGNYDDEGSPGRVQEQGADWLQIGIRGWAN
jgi:hypothetical protein